MKIVEDMRNLGRLNNVKKGLIAVGFVLCTATAGLGLASGGGNFGSFGYPAFMAEEPVSPPVKNLETAKQYRLEMEEYLRQVEAYQEAAREDIARINEEAQKATDRANEVIEAFNRWAETNG